MDNAVDLVQVYLRLNGYFTVTEYPVIEVLRHGGYRAKTDIDILAVRFANAGRPFVIDPHSEVFEPDPVLGATDGDVDMIIAEVKEGKAELNEGATNFAVLRSALLRFGCCGRDELDGIVKTLLNKGHARTPCGHHVRLMAFGSTVETPHREYRVITLGQVTRYLENYIRNNWPMIRQAQFKDPAFGFLAMREKARCGERHAP
jgi:hypothetical protein